jgi:hypothetical protein
MRMHRKESWLSRLAAALLLAGVLLGGVSVALADHGHGSGEGEHGHGLRVRGVVTAFTLGSGSGSGSGTTGSGTGTGTGGTTSGGGTGTNAGGATSSGATAIGEIRLVAADGTTVTAAVYPNTLIEAPAAVLAGSYTGAAVSVWLRPVSGGYAAVRVEFQPPGEDEGVTTVKGTLTAVTAPSGSSPGSISIQLQDGATFQALLDPQAVVTVGDRPGTFQDLTVGARVKATWQLSGTQLDVVRVQVEGGHESSGDHSSGNPNGGNDHPRRP